MTGDAAVRNLHLEASVEYHAKHQVDGKCDLCPAEGFDPSGHTVSEIEEEVARRFLAGDDAGGNELYALLEDYFRAERERREGDA